MSMPKMRGQVPQRKFADSARAARAGTGQRFKKVAGTFDRLKLGDKPIWVRFSPDQLYAQRLYDRETKNIIETGNAENPARQWFEYVSHFVPAKNRPMTCSSGADRQTPCRGCAVRARFYDNIKMREDQTSVKDEEARKNPPVQSSTRYAMAVTVLEKIFEVQVTGKGGAVRKNKDGVVITQNTPAPLSGMTPMKQKETAGEFGRNYHWSFGSMHLSQLASIDADLANSCACCGSHLVATQFTCRGCEGVVYEDPDGIAGADLRSMRETAMKCPHCTEEGFLAPLLSCTGCSTPEEGSIMAFDLRLKLEKDMTDDKKSVVQLVDFRVPDYEKLFDTGTAQRVFELVYEPLDIVAICAPDSLDSQKWCLPEDLQAVDPTYHVKKKEAAAYGSPIHDEPADDPDHMSFDE